MKLTQKQLVDRLHKAHKVMVPGAAMILLAEALKQRHRVLEVSIEVAIEEGLPKSKIDSLKVDLASNESLGMMALDMIESAFGTEFLDKYVEGKVDITTALRPSGPLH